MIKARWFRELVKAIIKPAAMNFNTTGFIEWKADYVLEKYSDSKYILVTSPPKCSSTFMSKTLSKILDFDHGTLVSMHDRIEQDFYEPKLVDYYGKGYVIQQHLRGGDRHLDLLKKYDIQVVVLLRNIYDIVVSFYDHLHNENDIWFMVYIHPSFYDLDQVTQYDLLIDFLCPWIISYYVSWYRIEQEKTHDLLWVQYEDFIPNKFDTIKDILQKTNYPVDEAKIKSVLEAKHSSKKMRINKGVQGRGKVALSDEQKLRIKSLTRYYPTIDFSPLGL